MPELKETLVRYLEAVRVVVDDDAQYAHTEQLVREFIGDGNPEIVSWVTFAITQFRLELCHVSKQRFIVC